MYVVLKEQIGQKHRESSGKELKRRQSVLDDEQVVDDGEIEDKPNKKLHTEASDIQQHKERIDNGTLGSAWHGNCEQQQLKMPLLNDALARELLLLLLANQHAIDTKQSGNQLTSSKPEIMEEQTEMQAEMQTEMQTIVPEVKGPESVSITNAFLSKQKSIPVPKEQSIPVPKQQMNLVRQQSIPVSKQSFPLRQQPQNNSHSIPQESHPFYDSILIKPLLQDHSLNQQNSSTPLQTSNPQKNGADTIPTTPSMDINQKINDFRQKLFDKLTKTKR